MKATLMYRAGDVRIENIPDAIIKQPTDALLRITRACICGSDLWTYRTLAHSETIRRMGNGAIGINDSEPLGRNPYH